MIKMIKGTLYLNNNKYKEFVEKCNHYSDATQLAEDKEIRGQRASIHITKKNDNRFHLRFVYFLLNYKNPHLNTEVFLKLFVKIVLKIDNMEDIISVKREYKPQSFHSVDLIIETVKCKIAIIIDINNEEKLNISRFDFIKESPEFNTTKEIKIYYLIVNEMNIIDDSLESNYKNEVNIISFKKDILNWLDECQREIEDVIEFSNMYEVIKEYKNKLLSLEVKEKRVIQNFEVPLVVLETQQEFVKKYLKKEPWDGFFNFECDEYTFAANSNHWFK
ncbi:MAG: PD-(D/E)XK nuclease family protein [Sulfurimonas sp.]